MGCVLSGAPYRGIESPQISLPGHGQRCHLGGIDAANSGIANSRPAAASGFPQITLANRPPPAPASARVTDRDIYSGFRMSEVLRNPEGGGHGGQSVSN